MLRGIFFDNDSHAIKTQFGYKQFYWVMPFVMNINKIRQEFLKDLNIISLSNTPDFSSKLKEALSLSLEQKAEALYVSLTLIGNKYYTLGSDIETEKGWPISRNSFPELPDEERITKIKDENLKRASVAQQIKDEVDAEKSKRSNLPYNHQFEIDAVKAIGTNVKLHHNVILKVDHCNKVVFYNDPYGKSMPAELKNILSQDLLKEYSISENLTPQQHPEDHSNCSIWGTLNLKTLAEHNSAQCPDYIVVGENYIPFIKETKKELAALVGLADINLETQLSEDSLSSVTNN